MPFGFGNIKSITDTVKSTSGIFAYWTADTAVVPAGGNIIKLPDISGNNITARDLVPVTTGPVYIANDPNFANKPSISSSVANIRLQATFDVSLGQPYTCYHVLRIETAASAMFWRSNAGNNINSPGFVINSGPGTTVQAVQDSALAVTSVTSISIGNKVTCFVYDNANVTAQYFNDSVNAWAKSPGQGSLNTNSCAVITVGNFGTPVPHSWTALALFQGAHSQTQRTKIMKFLGDKYGILVT